jgi:hypothetical protein
LIDIILDGGWVYSEQEIERIRAKFKKLSRRHKNGCLFFHGTKDMHGYSRLMAGGKQKAAHRVAYELAYGEIPHGLYVLHSCDNRLCIEPTHLRAGTAKDNTQDMLKRGRGMHRGIKHPVPGAYTGFHTIGMEPSLINQLRETAAEMTKEEGKHVSVGALIRRILTNELPTIRAEIDEGRAMRRRERDK